jgi:hypothetical protein
MYSHQSSRQLTMRAGASCSLGDILFLIAGVIPLLALVACGSSGARHPVGDALIDAPAVGGERGTGGSVGSGGKPGSGGIGEPTGGAGGAMADGGKVGTGGSVGAGGTTATGGKVSTGGSVGVGGTTATGGKVGTGGGVGAGGATATGGKVGTGGGVGAGGATATGGKVGTGGGVGTGGLSGTGGTVGKGGALGGTGGADPSKPILDRPVRTTYACSVAAPAAELALGDGTWSGASLLFTAEKYWAGRWDIISNNTELQLSSLGFDGTLGAVTTLAQEYYGSQSSDLTFVERDGSFHLVWVGGPTGGAQTLKFAQVLPSGVVQTSPTNIVGTEGTWLNLSRLLPTSSGFVVSWVEGTSSAHRLHVAQLSATGALVGAPTTLWDPGERIVSAALVAVGDGFTLVVSSRDMVGTTTTYKYFALDAAGAQRASAPLSSFPSQPRMLAQGERLLLGWSDAVDRGVVHLARFDALGQAVGATVALQSPPAAGSQNMTPSLVDLDGDVAIAWSEGHAQRSVTDAADDVHLNFVIVDGDDLVPLSTNIEATSPKAGTGVYGQGTVRNGLDFLVLSRIASHLYARTASVGIRCSR